MKEEALALAVGMSLQRLQSGKLKILGGRYDLDTGMVTLIN